MNNQDLEMAKKIAEIEGVKLFQFCDALYSECAFEDKSLMVGGIPRSEYNPFSWTILGPLMIKYNVEPNYIAGSCSITCSISGNYLADKVYFDGKEDIPRAILECIIKSKEQ